jgi:hypothetical protein
MERVTLDADLSNQLCGAPLPIELCDAGGHSLGFFVPSKAAYAAITLPISEDELAAREQSTGGRTWQEIRADLERKYGPAQS